MPSAGGLPDTLDDVSEKDLLVAILNELQALNRTFAPLSQPRPTPTCCDSEENRIRTMGDPTQWTCRACGKVGET